MLPNFFIIGAAKSGTTALYHCLKQHPDVFMSPVKEPRYFSFDSGRGLFKRASIWRARDYFMLFAPAGGEQAIGEASPDYLPSPLAAARIRHELPHARLIAILRQPSERAYSHYLFYKHNLGIEPAATFAEALLHEEQRRNSGWFPDFSYRGYGFYYGQLQKYFKQFPSEQIRVYLYEDWNREPLAVLRDIFRFLGVDDGFRPAVTRDNATVYPRMAWLHRMAVFADRVEPRLGFVPKTFRRSVINGMRRMNRMCNLNAPPPIPPDIRRELTEGYRADILKLEGLIGRDLSHWLTRL